MQDVFPALSGIIPAYDKKAIREKLIGAKMMNWTSIMTKQDLRVQNELLDAIEFDEPVYRRNERVMVDPIGKRDSLTYSIIESCSAVRRCLTFATFLRFLLIILRCGGYSAIRLGHWIRTYDNRCFCGGRWMLLNVSRRRHSRNASVVSAIMD